MQATNFLHQNYEALQALVAISSAPGKRPDYVQGGGGNTSAKLLGGMMAIKASGYRLCDVTVNDGYAVLSSDELRRFFSEQTPDTLVDPEQSGTDASKAAAVTIKGLPELRPSIEAGMHAVLDTFVLHTHPVYANLAGCTPGGREVLSDALKGSGFTFGFVPYQAPGALLTFAVKAECERVKEVYGEAPTALLLGNHGLVVTHSDANECMRLHDEVNRRIAARLGVSEKDYPAVKIASQGEAFISQTPWLQALLKGSDYSLDFFCKASLYPDQVVFLSGKLAIVEKGEKINAPCTIDRATGNIVYRCSYKQAMAIEETLCAVLFITRTLQNNGLEVQPMDAAAKSFIAGMEGEKYRQTIGQ